MTVNEAVRELRHHLGESQQAFAQRLGISIRAVGNYEKDRRPDSKGLSALLKAARIAQRIDLASLFSQLYHNSDMNDPRVQAGLQDFFKNELGLGPEQIRISIDLMKKSENERSDIHREIGERLINVLGTEWAEQALSEAINDLNQKWQRAVQTLGSKPEVTEFFDTRIEHLKFLLAKLRQPLPQDFSPAFLAASKVNDTPVETDVQNEQHDITGQNLPSR